MVQFSLISVFLATVLYQISLVGRCEAFVRILTNEERLHYKEKIKSMFYHSYDSYLKYAGGFDELMPITCSGMNTWGTFSLSLIDALDTLAIMGNYTEFRRVAQHIIDTASFETNTNVSVFETNIRVIGGLLSAHLLSVKTGLAVEEGWPCTGPLLRLAENVARKLLPAFDTATGMPYGTVNFLTGVPENETPVTCTAGVGTFIVEFGTLSRLTGDPIFEQKALVAMEALQKYRSKMGLLGNHVNVQDGKWVATEAGIGAGVDSYFEYLVKGAFLLQMPRLIEIFNYDYELIKKYMEKNDWFVWVSMTSGAATMPIFQSLEAFFPGLLTLIGEMEQAKKSLYNYHQIWKQYGFVPEFYDIVNSKLHKRDGYPLRPEFIESVLYLYQATKDPHLLNIGTDVIDSIHHSSRTECGYATIKSVYDHDIEDRMESFFLAETLKYLYLLFDEDNFMHNKGSQGTIWRHRQASGGEQSCIIGSSGYVFNTEAHPVDIAALSCCDKKDSLRKKESHTSRLKDDLNFANLLSLKKMSSYELEQFLKQPINTIDLDLDSKHNANRMTSDESAIPNVKQDSTRVAKIQNSCSKNEKNSDSSELRCLSDSIEDSTSGLKTFDTVEPYKIEPTERPLETSTLNAIHVTSDDDEQLSSSSSSFDLPTPIINTFESNSDVPYSQIPNNYSINVNDYYDELKQLAYFLEHPEERILNSQRSSYELLRCPSQEFLMRLSLHGQMMKGENN